MKLGGLPVIQSGVVIDPCAWLEGSSEAAMAWREEEAKRASCALSDAPPLAALVDRIRSALSYETRTVPIGRSGRYFFLCSPEGAERLSLWVSAGPADNGQQIADPTEFDQPDCLAEFGSFWPSFDGQHVVLAVTRGGRQGTQLVLLRVDDSVAVSVIDALDTPTFAWAVWHDNNSFFWSRRVGDVQVLSHRTLDGREAHVPMSVDATKAGIVPMVSEDRQWLLVLTFIPGQPGCRLHAAVNDANPSLIEVEGFNRDGLVLAWWTKQGFLFVTSTGDGSREILFVDFGPLRNGKAPVLRPLYRDETGNLTGACALPGGDVLLVDRAPDGGNAFRRLRAGGTVEPVEAPSGVALGDWTIDRTAGRFVANFQQWDAPARLVTFRPGSMDFEVLRETPLRIALTSTRAMVSGEDGVEIPVTLIRAKDRQDEREVPCLLWGYGGFGLSITPNCMMSLTPWLESGGMVAIAHVRGGGELGPLWHEAGKGPNKRVSFSDMIRVARWIVDEGHTRADRLCLWGGSAGGLLVLGAAVLAPDICAAVIAENPVADLAKFTAFKDDGAYWTVEFGDTANDPAALARAAEWSPLHNLKPSQEYPATLILVGGNDERVSPIHGRKMTAALQATGSRRPHLLLEKAGAGHAGHVTVSEAAHTRAELLSFAAWRTGLKWMPAAG